MKTKWTLLPRLSDWSARPSWRRGRPATAVVTGLTGTVRIQQGIPCADVDVTRPVTGGAGIEPRRRRDVGAQDLHADPGQPVAGFSVSRSCLGIGETAITRTSACN
jgi:hypothetical protein